MKRFYCGELSIAFEYGIIDNNLQVVIHGIVADNENNILFSTNSLKVPTYWADEFVVQRLLDLVNFSITSKYAEMTSGGRYIIKGA